jgi:RND superfamily putative drug exporter
LFELTAANSPLADETFVSQASPLADELTRLWIILEDEPFSAAAVSTCREIRSLLEALRSNPDSPWYGADFELLGPTSGILDLERVTLADRRRIEICVVVGVFLVLLALLRRVDVCCYLIASVLLSYFVTLGATELILSRWYGEEYMGLDWKVPVFLFVVLVAVGQDYNVYLVTRVFEEQRRLGPIAGLRQGIVRTGGIITSCGLIMAGAFASMLVGSLRGMVELGIALSLGILLDTLVIRTILVPSYLALLARAGRAPVGVSQGWEVDDATS